MIFSLRTSRPALTARCKATSWTSALWATPLILLLTPAFSQAQVRRPPTAPAVWQGRQTSYPIPTGAIFVAPTGDSRNSGQTADAPTTLERAVALAPVGGTLVLRGGTYRGVSLSLTKKLTLQAFAGEIPMLKGSVVVTQWVREGNAWRHNGWNASFPPNVARVYLDPKYPMAGHRDMVFLNDAALIQVASAAELKPGAFWVHAVTKTLWIGDDPTGKTVEATAYGTAISLQKQGDAGADGSIVRGLHISHYADAGLFSARPNVTLENNTLVWNGQQGAKVYGPNLIVRGNTFSCNGRQGLGCGNVHGALVENNTFSYNNVENFAYGWDAGGFKIGKTDGLTFRGNLVERNFSNGVWLDVSIFRAVVSGNTVRHNNSVGMIVELSHDITLAFNLIHDNIYHCGIMVWDSSKVRVYNNTLARNRTAVLINDTVRVNNLNDADVQPGESLEDFNKGNTLGRARYGHQKQHLFRLAQGCDSAPRQRGQLFAALDGCSRFLDDFGVRLQCLFPWLVAKSSRSALVAGPRQLQRALRHLVRIHRRDRTGTTWHGSERARCLFR